MRKSILASRKDCAKDISIVVNMAEGKPSEAREHCAEEIVMN